MSVFCWFCVGKSLIVLAYSATAVFSNCVPTRGQYSDCPRLSTFSLRTQLYIATKIGEHSSKNPLSRIGLSARNRRRRHDRALHQGNRDFVERDRFERHQDSRCRRTWGSRRDQQQARRGADSAAAERDALMTACDHLANGTRMERTDGVVSGPKYFAERVGPAPGCTDDLVSTTKRASRDSTLMVRRRPRPCGRLCSRAVMRRS
ncbi:hypothetical protein BC828DRAFT_197229 [Blastocladiella britannica]|nr:hypothetical protein BC828DRAFT_197229 [Blastocladiella britannica]